MDRDLIRSLAEPRVQTVATAPKMEEDKRSDLDHQRGVGGELEPTAQQELLLDQVLESEQDKVKQCCHLEKDPIDLKRAKAVEENGEAAESVCNGAESISEGEGADANSGSLDSSGDAIMFPLKPDSCRPAENEGKKQYDREFLLDFQFMPTCIQKPEGLPPIRDVVLDKINQPKLPMRSLDPQILPQGPDFTPAFAEFRRHTPGGRGVPISTSSLQPNLLGNCHRHLV